MGITCRSARLGQGSTHWCTYLRVFLWLLNVLCDVFDLPGNLTKLENFIAFKKYTFWIPQLLPLEGTAHLAEQLQISAGLEGFGLQPKAVCVPFLAKKKTICMVYEIDVF